MNANPSFFQFDLAYNPALDPTPEDEVYTPTDLITILFQMLLGMEVEDFNLFRERAIPEFQRLLREGVPQNGVLVLPAEPEPAEITAWNDDGFSEDVVDGCVQSRVIRETADKWRGSGNRLLRESAIDMRQAWYMLPLARLMENAEFHNRYMANLFANRGQIVGISGRGGYSDRPVFSSVLSEPVTINGRQVIKYQGLEPLADRWQPTTGTNPQDTIDLILDLFTQRFSSVQSTDDNGLYAFLVNGSARVWKMDREPQLRTEEWRPSAPEYYFQRAQERADAWAQARLL